MPDPYAVLGVQRTAGADEIKAAWRTKAKSVHPDHNREDPEASSRFAEIGRAYDVLKDPERRRRYDRAAEAHQTIMQQRQSAREAAERAKAAQANAERVMEELARANAKRAQENAKRAEAEKKTKTRPSSQDEAEAPEDIVERIFGASQGATAKAAETPRSQTSTFARAPDAKVSGQVHQEETSTEPPLETKPLPFQAVDLVASLVRRIRGINGQPDKAPDHAIEAAVSLDDLLKLNPVTIKLSEDRDVRLTLSAGMTAGHVVRLKGQGLKVSGLQRGDLLVTVRLEPDYRFRVEDFDIHTTLPISLEDAVLGTETEVETPDGKHPVSIPPWSGSDRTIKLEGFGLFDENGLRGDLIVELRVMLWEKPDAKVTDLMRHMREGLYI